MGLLGAGGSVLMIPVFVYIARIPVNEAIALSLLIAGLSSAVGVVKYSKQGFLNRRLVVLFILPGIFTSFIGARSAQNFSSEHMMLLFGLAMLFISIILYRKSGGESIPDGPVICRPSFLLSIFVGSVVGFLTGFLGVGGGFLIVPAIALLMRCSLHTAIGTSLAIITINSSAGFLGHLPDFSPDFLLNITFLIATMVGVLIGTRVSDRLSVSFIQKTFAMIIFLVGVLVVAQSFY